MLYSHASSARPPLPPFFSVTIPKKNNTTRTSHKIFFEQKKKAHVGMEPSKTNQTQIRMTPQPSLHIVPFCQLCTPQNSLHAYSLFTPTKWTQYSALLTSQPSTQKTTLCVHVQQQNFTTKLTLQHTIQTQHCSCTPQFLHTRQTISAMLSSNYNAATHNVTQSPCTLHTRYYPPHCLPQPSYMHTTNKHRSYLAKWHKVQGWLWCHYHLVWFVFEAPCFHSVKFFVILIIWLQRGVPSI